MGLSSADRERALARFQALGFPPRGDEAWKYTNAAPIAERSWTPAPAGGAVRSAPVPGIEGGFFFANGHLTDVPALPPGVAGGRLSAHEATAAPHLGRTADFERDAFVALNTAHASDGAFVLVPPGVQVETPIVLRSAAAGDGLAGYPRVLVVAGAGSRVSIVACFEAGTGATLTAAVTEVVLLEGARVDYVKVQDEAPGAFHVDRVCVRQARDSHFASHDFVFGAALSRTDWRVLLDGPGAECSLQGCFALGGTQHADTDTFVDHAHPQTTSAELYKGVLAGRAHGVFTGRVLVRPGASKTNARQSNPNLLLSRAARIDTRPQLEIRHNDVKCTHGATVGRLDADALFYLRSRGVGFAEARRMLTGAFGGEIADGVGDARLAEWLRARIAAAGAVS